MYFVIVFSSAIILFNRIIFDNVHLLFPIFPDCVSKQPSVAIKNKAERIRLFLVWWGLKMRGFDVQFFDMDYGYMYL